MRSADQGGKLIFRGAFLANYVFCFLFLVTNSEKLKETKEGCWRRVSDPSKPAYSPEILKMSKNFNYGKNFGGLNLRRGRNTEKPSIPAFFAEISRIYIRKMENPSSEKFT